MNIDSLVVPELNEDLLTSKIYIIRGQKFLLREFGLMAIKVVEHLYLTFLQNKEYICS